VAQDWAIVPAGGTRRLQPGPWESGSHETPRWRGESAANSSLKMPNSLLAGKIQGISPIRGLAAPGRQRKRARNQFLTSQFPTHPNREFFAALQGIKSGDQGNFCPDQGIPLSSAIWAFALPTIRSPPTDPKRCREGEPRRRCSKSPKPISSSGAPRGVPQIARRVRRRERSGVPGFTVAAWSRVARASAPSSP
jgi:hypothetical protein